MAQLEPTSLVIGPRRGDAPLSSDVRWIRAKRSETFARMASLMRFRPVERYFLFGGGPLLASCVVELQDRPRPLLVITSARHLGEIVTGSDTTLDDFLRAHAVDHVASEDVCADEKVISQITPGVLAISIGAAWIFDRGFIARFAGQLLNRHAARLPRGRGGGGLSWQILMGDRLGACVLHQVEERVDAGPIVKYREFVYPAWCRVPADYQKALLEEDRKFMAEFFAEVEAGAEFAVIEQQPQLSSYWPRLSTEHHGYIDWSWDLRQIERFICAFDEPYKGASTFVDGRRVFLKDCFVEHADGVFHPFQKGLVYRRSKDLLFVATEDGTLVIGKVADEEGTSVMSTVYVGHRFHTPVRELEKARLFRAVYGPGGLTSARGSDRSR